MERIVTAIKVQKRNPNRVNVDLDGEFAFGLSRIVSAWLNVGDRLTELKVEELLNRDSDEVIYQKALNLISRRPRSEKEIRQKMAEKQYETSQVDRTIERLKGAGLIADEKFAEMWVENRSEYHPRSQRLIRYELRNKGIEDDTIENALKISADDAELARRAAVQYEHRLDAVDWLTYRKRLSGFLARRGFSYGTVFSIVQELWNSREQGLGNLTNNEEF